MKMQLLMREGALGNCCFGLILILRKLIGLDILFWSHAFPFQDEIELLKSQLRRYFLKQTQQTEQKRKKKENIGVREVYPSKALMNNDGDWHRGCVCLRLSLESLFGGIEFLGLLTEG